jgi:hypothetical protein
MYAFIYVLILQIVALVLFCQNWPNTRQQLFMFCILCLHRLFCGGTSTHFFFKYAEDFFLKYSRSIPQVLASKSIGDFVGDARSQWVALHEWRRRGMEDAMVVFWSSCCQRKSTWSCCRMSYGDHLLERLSMTMSWSPCSCRPRIGAPAAGGHVSELLLPNKLLPVSSLYLLSILFLQKNCLFFILN